MRSHGQVLIHRAGGGAGSFAIQLAKLHGEDVTGVDNAGKLDFMRSLGADHVIDRRYASSEAPEGLRYVADGHAKGKVVISNQVGLRLLA